MVSVIDILCFESPKILSLRFEGDEVILTEKEILEYFNLGNKNISLQWDQGQVERMNIATDVIGFVLKVSISREFTVHTFCSHESNPTKSSQATNQTLIRKDQSSSINSIFPLVRGLPLGDSLLMAMINATKTIQTDELPIVFDGDIVFELPVCPIGKPMQGMEQKYDGHPWVEYCTCTKDTFPGVVRRSSCGGHLRCFNLECPYYERSKQNNQSEWKGRLKRVPLVGILGKEDGTLVCRHCLTAPECLATCECCIYYCYAKDQCSTTRCVIHQGSHRHPVSAGESRKNISAVNALIQKRAAQDLTAKCKKVEVGVTNDIILQMLNDNSNTLDELGEFETEKLLERVTPLSQRKRIQRSMEIGRQNIKGSMLGLEALLDLKGKTQGIFPFFCSILFPDQLASSAEPHVFKMSSIGPGCGVDLVNQMRPGGLLEKQYVHFDHVHRVHGWTTMSAHVYHPFLRELLTIAIGEFKVENTNAQVQFWRMLNETMRQAKFQEAQFAGFMADEAQANWLAVREVFNSGKKNIMFQKERSCSFHWEKSMLEHTRLCIKSQYQEEHKELCRRWRDAPTEISAEIARDKLINYWQLGHAHEDQLVSLQTWLYWWEVRGFHWSKWFLTQVDNGPFVPTTNLSESKHASMRAALGYAQQVSLYSACSADLAMAVLQSAHFKAYLSGRHEGSGPGLLQLKNRFLSGKESAFHTKQLVDLTTETIHKHGIVSTCTLSKKKRSLFRKRRSASADTILDTDSHRPEYETITIHMQGHGGQSRSMLETARESEVDVKEWAIRRTPPKCQATCWGVLEGKTKRCGAYVHDGKEGRLTGIPAPSFKGRRQYKDMESWQTFWFCPSNVYHAAKVDGQIQKFCGQAPLMWKIQKGTYLTQQEITNLLNAGFFLEGMQSRVPSQSLATPCSIRPKTRGDGRMIKWKEKIGRKNQECIDKSRLLEAEIVRETQVIHGESHILWVSTTASKDKGLAFAVTICEFPRCSCPDFVMREVKKETYMPCEHLYFVFIRVLGLDPKVHKYMHQGALTKLELSQALLGRRNVPSAEPC